MEPTSKIHELTLRNIESRIDYSADLMNFNYQQMKHYGLFDNQNSRKDQVIAFHKKVCLENPLWPENYHYSKVYRKAWESFEENGFYKIIEFIGAVNLIKNQLDPIVQKEKEKPIPPEPIIASGGISRWTDQQLINSWKMIVSLYDTEMIRKRLDSDSSNMFTKKVYNELIKRGIEPKNHDTKKLQKV